MSHSALMTAPPAMPRASYSGVTRESASADAVYAEAFRAVHNSVGQQRILGETNSTFANLVEAHSIPDWDGEGAERASPKAAKLAYDFIVGLPPKLSKPDASVNRYGDIELEWYVRPDRLLTLAIGDDGRYHFASLIGEERRSGAGYLKGTPPPLLLAISDVIGR